MKYLVALSAILAFVCGAQGVGMRVRFNLALWGAGSSFFYETPISVSDATNMGWTKQPRADDHLPNLELYCPPERTFCCLYDDTGYVAGTQISLDQDKYTNSVFDWGAQGFTEWEPANDGKRYWTIQQFFVDETLLAIDGNERINSRNQDKILQTDGIWARGTNRQLLKIPTTQEGLDNSAFTKQACIPWMGTHYYYNMSATTECTSEGIMPWFPLLDGGEVIGIGLMTFGSLPIEDGERDWFERPDRTAVQTIVSSGPECLYQLADNPGVVTMHIYFVENPQLIFWCF